MHRLLEHRGTLCQLLVRRLSLNNLAKNCFTGWNEQTTSSYDLSRLTAPSRNPQAARV